MSDRRLIEILKGRGLLDEDGLKRAREWQVKMGGGAALAQVIMRLGIVPEEEMIKALSEAEGMDAVERIEEEMVDFSEMEKLPERFIQGKQVLLLRGGMGKVLLACWGMPSLEMTEEVQFMTNRVVEPVLVPKREVVRWVDKYLVMTPAERRSRAALPRPQRKGKEIPAAAASEGGRAGRGPAGRSDGGVLAEALAELLVEKGVLSRLEIEERLRKMRATEE